jgi:hypothetical protein
LNADVKRLYDEARQSVGQGDFKGALEKLALALSIVFKENGALRGFEAGNATTEDAIRVVGFGIHGNDFLALQQFLPRVNRWSADAKTPQWNQSNSVIPVIGEKTAPSSVCEHSSMLQSSYRVRNGFPARSVGISSTSSRSKP